MIAVGRGGIGARRVFSFQAPQPEVCCVSQNHRFMRRGGGAFGGLVERDFQVVVTTVRNVGVMPIGSGWFHDIFCNTCAGPGWCSLPWCDRLLGEGVSAFFISCRRTRATWCGSCPPKNGVDMGFGIPLGTIARKLLALAWRRWRPTKERCENYSFRNSSTGACSHHSHPGPQSQPCRTPYSAQLALPESSGLWPSVALDADFHRILDGACFSQG